MADQPDYAALAAQAGAIQPSQPVAPAASVSGSGSGVDYGALAKAAGAIDPSTFQQKPQVATGGQPGQLIPSDAKITAQAPSFLDRVKAVFESGNPNYSGNTAPVSTPQLITPEAFMTPNEQAQHPIATGVGEFTGGLTTPQGVALQAVSGGLGAAESLAGLPKAAKILPQLASAGFSAQQVLSGFKSIPQLRVAWGNGDVNEVEHLLTHMTLEMAAAAYGGQHAVTGKPAEPLVPGVDEAIKDYTKGAIDNTIKIADTATEGAKKNVVQPAKNAVQAIPTDIRSSIEDYLHPDPNEAAQKVLKPAKFKQEKAQEDLAGARPYLEGVNDFKELNHAVADANTEIWAPYKEALGQVGENPVQVSIAKAIDGSPINNVNELEAERLKTSADLSAWRNLKPTDMQQKLQQQGKITELNARYQNILDTLDPELESAGIDPKLIRKTWGQVNGVRKLIQGRNVLSETAQRYGISRIFNLDLEHPLNNVSNIVEGAKDIVAGRPWFSGKPTDVNVKEGFRKGTGGEKPNFYLNKPTATAPSTPNVPADLKPEVKVQEPAAPASTAKPVVPQAFEGVLKEAGATPMGIQKGDPEIGLKDYVLFQDPETKSTLALPVDKVTTENVRKQIEKSRAKFKPPTAE